MDSLKTWLFVPGLGEGEVLVRPALSFPAGNVRHEPPAPTQLFHHSIILLTHITCAYIAPDPSLAMVSSDAHPSMADRPIYDGDCSPAPSLEEELFVNIGRENMQVPFHQYIRAIMAGKKKKEALDIIRIALYDCMTLNFVFSPPAEHILVDG
jgi:hypothetical protein